MKRFVATLLAFSFLYSVGATAAGLRACPHHDRVVPEHQSHHASHGPDQAPADHDDGACTCLGGAQCAAPLALPSAGTAAVSLAAIMAASPEIRLEHQAAARVPASYLPLATAPPVLL
jgi:hypothetical protein